MKHEMDKNELLKASLEKIRQLKQEINEKTQTQDPIAVIGIACDFPSGVNQVESLWTKLADSDNMLAKCPENRLDEYHDSDGFLDRIGDRAGWLEDAGGFDAGFFRFSAEEALRTDPQQRLFLQTAWHALEDAGVNPQGLHGSNSGVFVGVYAADYEKRLYGYRDLTVCQGRDVMSAGQSFIAGRLSYFLGLHGPSLAIDSACSSSLVAIDSAVQNLRLGRCELAIVGGVNLLADAELTVAMAKAGMLSPDQCCRPFDASAKGIVRGEGCGVVVLKPLNRAIADGDPIRAVIQGSAVTQDGASSGPTVPYGPAQEKLLRLALKDADLTPEQIGYIEAHGTGTSLGDPIELEALANVYANSHSTEQPLYIGSIKGNLGHLEAASGMAGLIKTVLMVEQRTLLPSINFREGSSAIDWREFPVRVVTEPAAWTERLYAGVSSFGLSGTNAHVIVGPAPDSALAATSQQDAANTNDEFIIPFSARTLPQLQALAQSVSECQQGTLGQWQRTFTQGRAGFPHRLAWKGNEHSDLKTALTAFSQGKLMEGLAYQHSPDAAEVDFLFTGQGSQYWQMGLSWYRSFSVFKSAFDHCDELYRQHFSESLHDVLFAESGINLIDQTQYAQPALFALQYAQAQQWQAFGVRPASVLGHSVGEFAAAVIAGVMTLEDAVMLVGWRGKLMQGMPSDGGMLAVKASAEAVQGWIQEHEQELDTVGEGSLVISVYNAPEQQVVSGRKQALDALAARLEQHAISHQLLTVSHAFHSPQMKGMLDDFRNIALKIDYQPANLPFYSSVTGELLQPAAINADYWLQHIVSPVRYDRVLNTLLSRNAEQLSQNTEEGLESSNSQTGVALELGPRPVLSGLAVSHSQFVSRTWLTSQYADGQLTALKEAFQQLYCHGLQITDIESNVRGNVLAFEKEPSGQAQFGQKCHLPGYPFQRKHYWLPLPDTDAIKTAAALPLLSSDDEESALHIDLVAEGIQIDDWLAFVRKEVCLALGIADGDPAPSAQDNLLLWGVDSILLLRLIQRWQRTTLRQLKIAEALSNPTLQAWSDVLASSTAQQSESLQVTSADTPASIYPLTSVQRAYWAGRRSDMPLGGVACYLYQELQGSEIDLERLEKAFNHLIARHDALRSRFLDDGLQEVLPSLPYQTIPFHDFSHLSAPHADASMAQIRQRLSHHVADCMQPPLLVIEIVRMPDGKHHFCFGIDFLIADAFSLHLFWRELSDLYRSPDSVLPQINLHFSDYIQALQEWQESQSWQAAKRYWQQRIETLPSAPELPVVQSPDTISCHRFQRLEYTLSTTQWQAIKASAAELGITPSVSILTAYAQVLERWGVSNAFSLTLTLFNRLPVHDDIHRVIADFTSLILFEVNTTDTDYVSLATRLQHQLATDLQYRDFSAIDLLDAARQQGREISSPVVFTSTLGVGGESLFDTDAFGQPIYGVSQTPQVWLDLQIYEQHGELLLCWDYVEALFPEGLMADMFSALTSQLTSLAAGSSQQWGACGSLPLPSSQRNVRTNINATEHPLPVRLLHQGFYEQCAVQPEQIALVFRGNSWSYDHLACWVGRVISCLQQYHVAPEERVAIIMPKHPAQVAACLAILGCGAVFVPIDAKQPVARQNQLIEQANCRLVLTLEGSLDLADSCQQLPIDEQVLSGYPVSASVDGYSLEQLAYIIFTSGSTGIPKGVMISHRSASNTILDINRRFDVTADDCVLAISALHFDLSVYDIFGLLTAGGTVVLVDDDDHYEPQSWYHLCQHYGVSVWNSVPQLLDLFVDFCESKTATVPASLRLAMVSGDWVPTSLPERSQKSGAEYQLIALGGATEAAIWSNYFHAEFCAEDWRSIPYGYPLANQSYCVLDEKLTDCPDWVRGDLFITGDGLAQGYLDDREKTEASFIIHPETKVRLYRTGDKARYWPDGTLEFLGRDDQQVKINGYRVELGEIESKLALHPNVARAVVMASGRKQRQLLGFVVESAETVPSVTTENYKTWLADYVPAYMVPNQIVCIAELPLTANGKVDRKALLKIAEQAVDVVHASHQDAFASKNTVTENIAAENTVTSRVIALLEKRLSVSPVKTTDNLLRLGASSIDMIRLANDLEKAFGQRPKINELTRLESVSALIALYQKAEPDVENTAKASGWTSYLKRTPLLDDVDARALYKKSRCQLRNDLNNGVELPDIPLETLTIEQRRSRRQFSKQPISLTQFTALLNGLRPDASGRHVYASAGATYPVQMYFYIAEEAVEELVQGLYYYQPHTHQLHLIEQCDLALTDYSMSCRTWQTEIGFACFLVAELKAIAPLYGPSAREFALIEAGAICQMLESGCHSQGIGLCQVGDFDFDRIAKRMAVSDSHLYLHTLMGGSAEPSEHIDESNNFEDFEGGEL